MKKINDIYLITLIRARSSAVEHYGDIVGVAGSNPAAPTIEKNYIYICLLFMINIKCFNTGLI